MDKTIAVIGAGLGIGLAVARKFGREGFKVALLARNAEKLGELADRLAAEGIEAAAFAADAGRADQLQESLRQVKARFGTIDVLEFGPRVDAASLVEPRNINAGNVQGIFSQIVLGAVTAVQEVLPDMLARQDGALLFTGPASAISPVLFSSNLAISAAGLRNYASSLYVDLASEGIYSGMVTIAGLIGEDDAARKEGPAADAGKPGGEPSGDDYRALRQAPMARIPAAEVADTLWDSYVRRDREEVVLGDSELCNRMRAAALQRAKPAGRI